MAPGDYFVYSLTFLLIIVILLLINIFIWNKQMKSSKDIEEAIYRLIEITKKNSNNEH